MWELLRYLCTGFLVITWVLIILTGINSFDMNVLHNKDAWWVPISVLTLLAIGGYNLSSKMLAHKK